MWRYIVLAMIVAVAGCASTHQSTAVPADVVQQGLVLERSLPKELPDESSPFPDSQFVLITTDNAAGMLVPVPFVAEAVIGALNTHQAGALARKYASVDPYAIVQAAMAGSSLLSPSGHGVVVHPLAYMIDCSDEHYRIALVARMQRGDWTGRYLVHLPTTYGRTALAQGKDDILVPLRAELVQSAATLRSLLEKDARGELTRTLYKADVGSMHLACSTVSAIISPKLMLAFNADVVEEGADYVIVRIAGDYTHSGPTGGLMFGLHYLRKDQLHTFKRR